MSKEGGGGRGANETMMGESGQKGIHPFTLHKERIRRHGMDWNIQERNIELQ